MREEKRTLTQRRRIRAAVMEAMANRSVSSKLASWLKKHELMRRATTFRESGGRGDVFTLWYEIDDTRYQYPDPKGWVGPYGAFPKRVRCAGYLGFDTDLTLVTIDERKPYEIFFLGLDPKKCGGGRSTTRNGAPTIDHIETPRALAGFFIHTCPPAAGRGRGSPPPRTYRHFAGCLFAPV